ncbi:hypothetical protein LTR36_000558 [Oleoguttula mirabilis]|uniref:Uncharacterized protein n=1 Tax=Oleoguttula mirabilis TaxID=1507867 RepID=A0AAV9JPR4_9PEZI|nr:hypothetical protein LTR36_000558 [Oleoguttula mirabilis]
MARKRRGKQRAPDESSVSPAPTRSAEVHEAPCHLLGLPNELLLPIIQQVTLQSSTGSPIRIDEAVGSTKPSVNTLYGEIGYRQGTEPLLQPAIAGVCRFLRQEALPLFYDQNIFYTRIDRASLRAVRHWLDCIGEANAMTLSPLVLHDTRLSWNSCYCDVVETVEWLMDALNESPYTLAVRVATGMLVLERFAGAFTLQIRLDAPEQVEAEGDWEGAKDWVRRVGFDCQPLSRAAISR